MSTNHIVNDKVYFLAHLYHVVLFAPNVSIINLIHQRRNCWRHLVCAIFCFKSIDDDGESSGNVTMKYYAHNLSNLLNNALWRLYHSNHEYSSAWKNCMCFACDDSAAAEWRTPGWYDTYARWWAFGAIHSIVRRKAYVYVYVLIWYQPSILCVCRAAGEWREISAISSLKHCMRGATNIYKSVNVVDRGIGIRLYSLLHMS